MRFRLLSIAVAAAAVGLATATTGATAAPADAPGPAHATGVGLHNTYSPAAFGHLAEALDTGASMIELDAWDDIVTREWKVSHGNPLGNDNNCVAASTPADLYRGGANKDLGDCLDDVRIWLSAHPDHPLLTIKLELKAGFDASAGLGPDQLDDTVRAHLGAAAYTPARLLAKPDGGSYATLDAAARADNWPGAAASAGKALVEIIPGTVEQGNPTDTLWTDVEYARHLRDLSAAGTIDTAQVFPAVLGAAAGDPRERYDDATIRPWFVLFDGDAASYVDGIDTGWYDTNHYLLVMTDAQNVPPALDDTHPDPRQAAERVAALAAAHASIVSCDWTTLPAVLGSRLPRG